MRRSLTAAACVALTACAGCGGFSVPDQPDSASRLPARALHIGRSAALHTPGGGRIRLTLLSYDPRERERSATEPDQPVAGIELAIRNVGKRPLHLGPPNRYATLLGIDGLGENAMASTTGPCGGPFQSTPIHLAPGKATRGCIPWSYPTNKPPFEFIFAFSKRATHGWILPH